MSPKDLAVRDIKEDLRNQNKCFLAFRQELNPIMRKLVSQHIKAQREATNPFNSFSQANSQLIARCFFSKGEVIFENYTKYYK